MGMKKILVVDDDTIVLLILRDALGRVQPDYEIVTAKDGREALTLLRDDRFDLLVTDLGLPGITGITLTEEARELHAELPVVWITAYGCHNVCAESDELGVCCCLDKPVDIERIREAVRAALQ
ncbi:MAG: response regulator [Chloroflexi bacterium]|nr:response regulator [Chloroflexota bacterium]